MTMLRAVRDEEVAPQSVLTCTRLELALQTQALYAAELMPGAPAIGEPGRLQVLADFGDGDLALLDTATAFSVIARAGDGAHDELVVTTERHIHVMRSVPDARGWRLVYVVLKIGRGTLAETLNVIRRHIRRPGRRTRKPA
jgi:hypothetical protein